MLGVCVLFRRLFWIPATSCSFAFAKVYTSKMPITACDLLHDRVLPFYENLGITVVAVLTDNGRDFCGKLESHPYELLLSVEGIEHRTTKVRSPRTNGSVERMNRTLLDECFRVQGRTQWYEGPDQIQRDLDVFMAFYNFTPTHQGYRSVVALLRRLGIQLTFSHTRECDQCGERPLSGCVHSVRLSPRLWLLDRVSDGHASGPARASHLARIFDDGRFAQRILRQPVEDGFGEDELVVVVPRVAGPKRLRAASGETGV